MVLTPVPNFNRPVKDLVYKDLLTSTFTQASHDRGIRTWREERTVVTCKESLPTSCGPHRNRFLEVQAEIRGHMDSDKKSLLAEANASAKRNLMSVGGCADTPVHVDTAGNADGKCPCHGNG